MARTDYEVSPALIKKRRNLLGLSFKQAAEAVGVSQGLIENWESGRVTPIAKSLEKLAKGYECEIGDFYPPYSSDIHDLAEKNLERYLGSDKLTERQAEISYRVFALGRPKDNIIETDIPVWAWRNPNLYGFESENCMAVKNYAGEKLVVAGPTRCSKTLVILEDLFHKCFTIPGLRVLVIRAKAVHLQTTIRPSITKDLMRFSFDDPMSPIKVVGKSKFTELHFPNSSEMVLIGADTEEKLLGSAWDIVYYSQVEQSTPEQIQTIFTRAAGTAGALKDENGDPKGLLICDANPDREDNHIYQMHLNGEIDWIEFDFEDNPLYFRGGKRTKEYSIVDRMDRNLEGVFHDRWFKGLWKSPEGAVFIVDDKNIVDKLPDLTECDIYRGCDWGQTHPSICIWVAVHKETKDITVYREWRKTHSDIDEMGDQMKMLSEGETIITTLIDWDENRQNMLMKRCNIASQFAPKGSGSVMDGIFLIQAALRRAVEGKAGGLYIFDKLLCNTDPHPDSKNYPRNGIVEMRGLMFDEKKDAPKNKGDDFTAALRYVLMYLMLMNDLSVYDYYEVIKREEPTDSW